MSFNDNVQLDTSQVQTGGSGGGSIGGGGGPGGITVGGGIGGIILLILGLIFGIPMGSDPTGGAGAAPADTSVSTDASGSPIENCKTGADANRDVNCLVVATANSVQSFWAAELPKYNIKYTGAVTVLYQGQIQSACGTASNQVGPFYCPLDQKIYIDSSFYDILNQQFGSSGGQLAQEYVLAHEYAHHLQNIFGILDRGQDGQTGPNSNGVRIELMADCLAGVWARHATETKDANGTPFLNPLTEQDIKDALSAAAAVGDDTIQEKTQGMAQPETWTHGSSEARQRWFTQGIKTGDLNQCDTFAVQTVE